MDSKDSASNQPIDNPDGESAWWCKRLAGPVAAAAAVRFALLALIVAHSGLGALLSPDTTSYLEPGRNLLLHGQFFADGVPDLVRTPVYPLFLAITSFVGPLAGAVANTILSILSVLIVWKIAKEVFRDDRIALGAAWIMAFEPTAFAYSSLLMSEELFLFLYLLSLERLTVFLRNRRLPTLAEAGLLLGAATLTRPVSYYLILPLAVGLLVVLARVPGLRWKAPALLLLTVVPWVAVWQVRNWRETGFSGISSDPDEFFYYFTIAEIRAKVEHRRYLDIQKEMGYQIFAGASGQEYIGDFYLSMHPEQRDWSQGQRLHFMHQAFLTSIRAHPGIYIGLCAQGALKDLLETEAPRFNELFVRDADSQVPPGFMTDDGMIRGALKMARVYPKITLERIVLELLLIGLYLFAARGLVLVVRGTFGDRLNKGQLWLLLGASLYFALIAAPFGLKGAQTRYRLPMLPAVAMLAVIGAGVAKRAAVKEIEPG